MRASTRRVVCKCAFAWLLFLQRLRARPVRPDFRRPVTSGPCGVRTFGAPRRKADPAPPRTPTRLSPEELRAGTREVLSVAFNGGDEKLLDASRAASRIMSELTRPIESEHVLPAGYFARFAALVASSAYEDPLERTGFRDVFGHEVTRLREECNLSLYEAERVAAGTCLAAVLAQRKERCSDG